VNNLSSPIRLDTMALVESSKTTPKKFILLLKSRKKELKIKCK
jgi:hypothetical protein